jgi:LysR family transcriptional regulator, carnitine catabolism transcriptional activator
MRLSARLLEAFLALEETRRFVVAASRCHVSPSAFSQMIGRLEEEVGARLFDRSARQVLLTPEGEAFAINARRIAAEMAASIEEIRDRSALRTGSVTVAAPGSVSSAWLPELMGGFRLQHPSIVLKLRDVSPDFCLELVLNGQADFCVNSQPGNELEFESSLRFNERYYVICRSSDPLAAAPEVSLRKLKGRDCIKTASVWRQLQADLTRAGVRDTGLEVEQFGTLAGLVLAGFGIGVVPQMALALCARPGAMAVPIKERSVTRPLYLVKRRDRSLSLAAQALWEFVEQRSEGFASTAQGGRGMVSVPSPSSTGERPGQTPRQ